MDIGLMTLLLAIATLLLAGVAVWSICQNTSIVKTERKIRLLNEINEWATAVADCGLRIELPINIPLSSSAVDNISKARFLEYMRLSTRVEYFQAIAQKLFSDTLYEAVSRVGSELVGNTYLRGNIVKSIEETEKETLFNFDDFEDNFAEQDILIINKIKQELNSGKDILELSNQYETSLDESVGALFGKIVDLKKELVG